MNIYIFIYLFSNQNALFQITFVKQLADGDRPQTAVSNVLKNIFKDSASVHVNNNGIKRNDEQKTAFQKKRIATIILSIIYSCCPFEKNKLISFSMLQLPSVQLIVSLMTNSPTTSFANTAISIYVTPNSACQLLLDKTKSKKVIKIAIKMSENEFLFLHTFFTVLYSWYQNFKTNVVFAPTVF